MLHSEGVEALILIDAASTIIHQRREMERMCGYPPEYGGDELLIKRIDEFLGDSHIKVELAEAKKFVKALKEET